MQLYLKDEIQEIKQLVKALFEQYMTLADRYKDQLLPGYTHLQIAMPSSFGLWFSAYAEILADEVLLLNTVHTYVTKIHSEVLLAMAVPSQLTDMTPQQRSGLTPEIQCCSSTNESGKT